MFANHWRPIKKVKALEAQTPENWKSRHCSNPSTAPPPNIQARPALRAPGSTRTQNPRAAPHPKAGEREKRKRHMSRSQKARTDDLVDALVYRLYELTEEKISPHFAVKP